MAAQVPLGDPATFSDAGPVETPSAYMAHVSAWLALALTMGSAKSVVAMVVAVVADMVAETVVADTTVVADPSAVSVEAADANIARTDTSATPARDNTATVAGQTSLIIVMAPAMLIAQAWKWKLTSK